MPFKKLLFKYILPTTLLLSFLIWDFYEPENIPVSKENLFSFETYTAENLLVQGTDENDDLWATRGMWAYKLNQNNDAFERQYRVPTGFNLYWFRNFGIVRSLTRRPECIELFVSTTGNTLAMSAGHIWLLKPNTTNFIRVLTLEHYGIGDLGIRNNGMIKLTDKDWVLGEYFRNTDKGPVKLFHSADDGINWNNINTFQSRQIRHIHGVQKDPYTGELWVLTGDSDHEASIIRSSDKGKNLAKIGTGKQKWRATQIIFTPEDIYWGADVTRKRGNESGIYKWNKNTEQLTKLTDIDGAIFYSTILKNNLKVFSTVREGGKNELDEVTRLFFSKQDTQVKSIEIGDWDWKGKYAKLRMQRTQNDPFLAFTILNHKQHNNKLVIIAADVLLNGIF